MPVYSFSCPKHGIYDLVQSINDVHAGQCSLCKRIFYAPNISGDLPTTKPKIGNTKFELLENLEKEGIMAKGRLDREKEDFEHQKKEYMDMMDKL